MINHEIRQFALMIFFASVVVSLIKWGHEKKTGMLMRLLGLLGAVAILAGVYQASEVAGACTLLVFKAIYVMVISSDLLKFFKSRMGKSTGKDIMQKQEAIMQESLRTKDVAAEVSNRDI